MNLRKVGKAVLVFFVVPLAVVVVGGYIVERIKGTPPDQIAAGMWAPFGAALGGTAEWLRAPMPLTRWRELVLLAVILWLAWFLLRIWMRFRILESTAVRGPIGELVDHITAMQKLSRKVAEGEKATAESSQGPAVAKGFQPNDVQICAVSNLLAYYPVAVSFDQLLTFELDALQAASVIVREPSGHYSLTRDGRDFMLDYTGAKNADEARATPETPSKASAKADPEKFKLSPLRVRALLALLDGVDARITLHDLYESTQRYSYEGGGYVDTNVSKGRLQQDMEEAANLGIVAITSASGGTSRYYALTEQGRNWVLQNEAVLRPIGREGMRRYT